MSSPPPINTSFPEYTDSTPLSPLPQGECEMRRSASFCSEDDDDDEEIILLDCRPFRMEYANTGGVDLAAPQAPAATPRSAGAMPAEDGVLVSASKEEDILPLSPPMPCFPAVPDPDPVLSFPSSPRVTSTDRDDVPLNPTPRPDDRPKSVASFFVFVGKRLVRAIVAPVGYVLKAIVSALASVRGCVSPRPEEREEEEEEEEQEEEECPAKMKMDIPLRSAAY